MTKSTAVKILNGALDELPDGSIVLRGVVDPQTLIHLLRDDYQREAMPLTKQSSILEALANNEKLPDIELGMRGQRFRENEGAISLYDPVYIIDGLQRVSSAVHFISTASDRTVRLGATIHFGTTAEWERERFRILNTLRTKVSPNVLLRNKREESRAIATLYGLSNNDKGFVLYDRIAWLQNMRRGELTSALVLAKVVGVLHSHKSPSIRSSVDELVPALDKVVEVVGLQTMRDNIKAFFELIDTCWGVKQVQYREGAAHMKGTFLTMFARLLSDHTDFWQDGEQKKLFISAPLRRKIALFPIHDPHIMSLASSAGKSREMLYHLIRDHINRGKTSKRLTPRHGDTVSLDDDEEAA